MTESLRILKYSLPSNVERFKEALGAGDRGAIYPVMHYILSRLDPLKTRAYLARYLVSVDIPPAFLHDESIQEVYQQYRSLQHDFKEAHKAAQTAKQAGMQPSDLKKEIMQLEDEKSQLIQKISLLEKKTESMSGFDELYEVTSALRQEQEEETKLQDQGREQQAALEIADQRLSETRHRFEEIAASQQDDNPEELVRRLAKEVRLNKAKLEQEIPRELESAYEKLGEMEQSLNEPAKTEQDIDDINQRADKIRRDIDKVQGELDRARRLNGGDDKLKMFRQQSAMIAKKLQNQQDEFEKAIRDHDIVAKEFVAAEKSLGSESSGGMGKRQFKEYANGLREKTNEYKQKKQELAALRAETVVLNRTESLMRSRGDNVEEFLKTLERGQGVEGARDMESNLEKVSKQNAQLNMTKKMTLEEISEIVRQLKDTLAKRKVSLTPQIQKLRTVRESFQELEQEYLEKKAIYENTAVGLESDKIKLENDCNAYQKECLREESRFHIVSAKSEIADLEYNKILDEQRFQKGDGQLLRDFKTYKELYQQKIQQQEQLSKQLRKKQKSLKETADTSSQQRQMFVDLKRLLGVKVQTKTNENQQMAGNITNGVFDLGQDIGGANIMTIEQGH